MTRTVVLPQTAMVEQEQPLPEAAPGLLAPCPPLPQAADSHLPALMKNHRQVAALYDDCRDRHAKLAQVEQQREKMEAARLQRLRAATKATAQPPPKHWWQKW